MVLQKSASYYLARKKNKGGLMEDYTRYQLDELYNILSQVQQAIELLEEEEKKKNRRKIRKRKV